MIDRMEKFQDDCHNLKSTLNASGRYSFQKEAMKNVVGDIIGKLNLQPTDTLLDVGCNCGDISIPLSFLCEHVMCVDGEGAIGRLKKRVIDIDNIDFMIGNFFDIDFTGYRYDCVLVYSVLMYVEGFENKLRFIQKACSLLNSNGRLLVGDIVNSSVKRRFESSTIGKKVDKDYKQKTKNLSREDVIKSQEDGVKNTVLNDRELFDIMYEVRSFGGGGYESFLLPQNKKLPFGYTRQDLLIVKY